MTLLTREFGKLSGIAKGAKASRRRFERKLEPFSHVTIYFPAPPARPTRVYYARRAGEARPPMLEDDLAKIALGSYMLELADALTTEEAEAAQAYQVLAQALRNARTRRGRYCFAPGLRAADAVGGGLWAGIRAMSRMQPGSGGGRRCGLFRSVARGNRSCAAARTRPRERCGWRRPMRSRSPVYARRASMKRRCCPMAGVTGRSRWNVSSRRFWIASCDRSNSSILSCSSERLLNAIGADRAQVQCLVMRASSLCNAPGAVCDHVKRAAFPPTGRENRTSGKLRGYSTQQKIPQHPQCAMPLRRMRCVLPVHSNDVLVDGTVSVLPGPIARLMAYGLRS